MYACLCCGYRTLPGRGDYDLCPVCWWEDDGVEAGEFSGPNAQTLLEGQQEFLADKRPYWRRAGKVRAPRRHEARAPEWRPFELTDDLMARVRQTHEQQRQRDAAEERRAAEAMAGDPEGPFKQYNAAVQSLRASAAGLSHEEVTSQLRELGREHQVPFPESYLELQARVMKDEDFYRRHPAHAAWWLLRHARPGTFRRRWSELRTGTFRFAG